jgi:hypothetical protein
MKKYRVSNHIISVDGVEKPASGESSESWELIGNVLSRINELDLVSKSVAQGVLDTLAKKYRWDKINDEQTEGNMKMLCPFCNQEWTMEMRATLDDYNEAHGSCGYGESVDITVRIVCERCNNITVRIVCERCNKVVYEKEVRAS